MKPLNAWARKAIVHLKGMGLKAELWRWEVDGVGLTGERGTGEIFPSLPGGGGGGGGGASASRTVACRIEVVHVQVAPHTPPPLTCTRPHSPPHRHYCRPSPSPSSQIPKATRHPHHPKHRQIACELYSCSDTRGSNSLIKSWTVKPLRPRMAGWMGVRIRLRDSDVDAGSDEWV
ncbi:hypothetical protein E2C01_027534 [Portunus trituberculatus]|uniref:Uncharacterized protein n=1 Tax=Portunus trituberculatus TaxID=210409 RepID=A0A5B7EL41_PORTR|nr:hypothetical protein [Portunus trituberculatus]